MIKTISFIFFGVILGLILKNNINFIKFLKLIIFSILLPYVVVVEISSTDLKEEWFGFFWGAGFVIFIFYLVRIVLKEDRNKSALFATAEGGTLGFIVYNIINTEPISLFFIIDMLGNGGALFLFIYYQINKQRKVLDFVKNPLIISMIIGMLLNFLGMKLLDADFLYRVEPTIIALLVLLVCIILGSEIKWNISKEIFTSEIFIKFWTLRVGGMFVSLMLQLPLAVVILFLLPPSFLLPLFYDKGDKNGIYASNFIISALPVFVFLAALLILFY